MAFRDDLIELVIEYLEDDETLSDFKPSRLLIDFTIDKFKAYRNYPKHFTDDDISKDLENHKNVIAMAIMDLASKSGAEGQTADSENGKQRTYENAYISSSVFKNIKRFNFVKVLNK